MSQLYKDKIKAQVENSINIDAALKMGEEKWKERFTGVYDVKECWKVIKKHAKPEKTGKKK